MRFKNSLQARILVSMLSTVVLIFVLLGVYVGVGNYRFAKSRMYEYIQLQADKDANEVKSILNSYIGYIDASSQTVLSVINLVNDNSLEVASRYLQSHLKSDNYIETSWILLSDISINDSIESSDKWSLFKESKLDNASDNSEEELTQNYILRYSHANSITVSEPYFYDKIRLIEVSAPIFKEGIKVGYMGFSLNLDLFDNLINEPNIYEGGYTSLLTNSSTYVGYYNSKFIGKRFSDIYPEDNKFLRIESKVRKGEPFEVFTEDADDYYYSFFMPISINKSARPWAVKVTVPMQPITDKSIKSSLLLVVISGLGLLLMILVIYTLTRRVVDPIKQVTSILELLSIGKLKDIKNININTGDELQSMAENLNHVVGGLKKTERFALEIRNGNLENEYALLGDSDQLGKILLSLQSSLVESRNAEETRKRESEEKSWVANGIAKFGDILRQDNTDMKKLGYNIVSNMISYLDANQGALFVLNDEDKDNINLELVTAIAYGRDKYIQKEIKVGEGLVGRCAHEKKTIYLTEIPESYVNIRSGLGNAQPRCVLIVPCIVNGDVFGVIELAAFTPLKPFEIEFIEKLGESVGSTMSSVRVNEKTAVLLSDSTFKGDQMAAQEEELRQSLEEMETTQEDLERQMADNTVMRETQKQQNALLDALLTSLPDYVYFKDKESKFLNISNSMLTMLGATSVDEVVGKSDFDYQTTENAQKYFDEEQRIIKTGKGITDLIKKEEIYDGTFIWNSITKLPLLTAEGECIGTFGISKNITEIKEIEQNAQKQSELLDALLNSIPDYIFFKDKNSKFLRISKSMISLFGATSVDEVIGKSDFDYHLHDRAQQYFDDEQRVLKTMKGVINQIQHENMQDGTVLWNSVTKLPLVTTEGECIGTFGISKEVTKLKETEIELGKQKDELLSVLEAIKSAFYVTEYDAEGVIVDTSESLLKLLSVDKDKVVGTNYNDTVTMANMPKQKYEELWAAVFKGEVKQMERKIVVNKKEMSLQEIYTPIVDDNGKVDKVLKIAFAIV